VDDVFLGPPLICEEPYAKDIQKCKEITIRKISGMGDVYPYFSAQVIPAGSFIYLKDSNCLTADCNYIISSPSGTVRVFCYKE
jgi:hypothetical protein